jgi:predicted dehydrogenase
MTVRIAANGGPYAPLIHIPGLQSEGFTVVGFCSNDRGWAAEEAARLGIPAVFSDFREVLELPGLEAVCIGNNQGSHYEIATAALRAGLHVLCEKPFALDASEAKEMVELARSTGRTAMVAHEFRFTSGRARMKELLDEGFIGTPKFALVRLLRGPTSVGAIPEYLEENDLASVGGGFLFRMGSHYIDALRHFFGEVVEVEGRLLGISPDRVREGQVVQADSDDTFFFTLRFASGVVAEMVGCRSAPFAGEYSISAYGSEGMLATPQRAINPPSHGRVLGARLGVHEVPVELDIPPRLEPFHDDRDERLFPFRLLVREFLSGINEGVSPHPNFEDGYRCMQVLDAVRESSRTGRRVRIEA